jgi:hypothetical protein
MTKKKKRNITLVSEMFVYALNSCIISLLHDATDTCRTCPLFFYHIQNRFWNLRILLFEGIVRRLKPSLLLVRCVTLCGMKWGY